MSVFNSFQFGDNTLFGTGVVDPDCLAIARSIMGRFHSPLVINKDDETNLQFRFILALAEAICTMRDEAIATHNDNFLSKGRPEHLFDVWGSLLGGFPYDATRTLAQNISFYQGLVKIFISGTDFISLNYQGTHAVNIIAAVFLFTLITGVRVYEFWRDIAFMFSSTGELFELSDEAITTESILGGVAVLGPLDAIPGRLGEILAGAQLVVPLDNYVAPNTDPIVEAKELVRPAMADLVLIYTLQSLFPGGIDPNIATFKLGRGSLPLNPLPADLAFEVFSGQAFQTYADSQWLPSAQATTRKRYFTICNREDVFGNVPITEAGLFDASGTLKFYRTFPAINKTDLLDVLFGWYVDFT